MTSTTAVPVAARAPRASLLYGLAAFAGFANLATEIIGPRMVASLFGSTTVVWAVIISVTLLGLSVGYVLGGRIPAARVRATLVTTLLANAGYLLLVGWLVRSVPTLIPGDAPLVTVDGGLVVIVALAAFFVPSVLFGLVSPSCVQLLAATRPAATAQIVGNVFALGTAGSVAGALAAAFLLIPYVGLTLSLRLFALGLVLFAAVLGLAQRRGWAAFVLSGVALLPQPAFTWRLDDGLVLLAQREGATQTVRVYGDAAATFVQMHLGPTFQSRMDLATRQPLFDYAADVLALAGEAVPGQRVLMLGGAGHALAHAFEGRGALVTEVEIDPVVVALSDAHFGPISGQVVIADARPFVEAAPRAAYDLIVLDVFDGAANVPPQLATREFFDAAARALAPQGRLVINFIGTPEGARSDSYWAFRRTLQGVFGFVAASPHSGARSQNVVFAAAVAPFALGDRYVPLDVPTRGTLLTDERNPMDVYTARARPGLTLRR